MKQLLPTGIRKGAGFLALLLFVNVLLAQTPKISVLVFSKTAAFSSVVKISYLFPLGDKVGQAF